MTLPVVLSSTSQVLSTEGANFVVAMPATVNAGDVLKVTLCAQANSASNRFPAYASAPSGWTKFADFRQASDNAHLAFFAKIADGTEGGTNVTFVNTGTNANFCVYSAVITRCQGSTVHSGSITDILEVATTSQGSGEPDPPSLIPSWGADDVLWGAAFGTGDVDTVTGWPANFTENQIQQTTSGSHPGAGDGATVGEALRSLNASSQDPGTFTVGSNEYCTLTWALRGSAVVILDVATAAAIASGRSYVMLRGTR